MEKWREWLPSEGGILHLIIIRQMFQLVNCELSWCSFIRMSAVFLIWNPGRLLTSLLKPLHIIRLPWTVIEGFLLKSTNNTFILVWRGRLLSPGQLLHLICEQPPPNTFCDWDINEFLLLRTHNTVCDCCRWILSEQNKPKYTTWTFFLVRNLLFQIITVFFHKTGSEKVNWEALHLRI